MIPKSELDKFEQDKNIVILTGKDFLSNTCENVDIKEGEEIAAKLFRVLSMNKNGIGLSANQIGINKKVCVINVKEPIYLINPRYEAEVDSPKLVYMEGCLSFPGEIVRTQRFASIEVIADNIEGSLFFDVSSVPVDEYMTNLDVLEIVAIQHEIDHLYGIEMFDREYVPKTIVSDKKPGRNEKVRIWVPNDSSTRREIKYKHLDEWLSKGYVIDL
jgi:peptide deformylase